MKQNSKKNVANKKGLSTIVTTLLLVLLTIVAVLIVWGVVSGMLRGSGGDIDAKSKCLAIDFSAQFVSTDYRSGGLSCPGIAVDDTNTFPDDSIAADGDSLPDVDADKFDDATNCIIKINRLDTNDGVGTEKITLIFKDASGATKLITKDLTVNPYGSSEVQFPSMELGTVVKDNTATSDLKDYNITGFIPTSAVATLNFAGKNCDGSRTVTGTL